MLQVGEVAAGEGDDGRRQLGDGDLLDAGAGEGGARGGAEAEATDEHAAGPGGERSEGGLGAEGGARQEDHAVDDHIDPVALLAQGHALSVDRDGADALGRGGHGPMQ